MGRALVAAPAYLERHGTPAQPDDLVAHPFIRVMGLFGDGVLRMLDAQQSPISARVTAAISVNHWRPVHELLVAGAGIGVLQEPVCANAIASGSLVRLLPDYTVPGFELNALCARPIPSRTRAIMALLEKELPGALRAAETTTQSEHCETPLERSLPAILLSSRKTACTSQCAPS
nr:LysR substrate-binding domain-containing protein [Paraburkholderia phenazinium]